MTLAACFVRRLALVACLAMPAAAGAAATGAQLDELASRLANESRTCAVAFATVAHGAVTHAGTASGCDPAKPWGDGAVFQAASLGKPVFAYLVWKLAARGAMDLDAPVVKYLPDGYLHRRNPFEANAQPVLERFADPRLGHVTPRMLLMHASGLPNWAQGPLAFGFPPGSSWQYSGEGYLLLQRAVEAATGEPLDTLARRLLFEPLGMSSSTFRWSAQFEPRVVGGRSANGQPRNVRMPEANAAASLYTTAGDYAKFMAALSADRDALAALTRDPVPVDDRQGLRWGPGWGIEAGPSSPEDDVLWQWGSNPGYRGFAMLRPATGEGIVVLTNSESGLSVARALVEAALPGEHRAFRMRMVR